MKRRIFVKNTRLSLFSALFPEPFYASNNTNEEYHPIIIVGSGYGAAVAALRLAESGKCVLILEMGRDSGR